ncbi:PREDICTED: centrosomal protein C10orf90-like, partial [Tinamus guttatus]|uniref:centrosomal protein C10orf90-like n=1 Tax=Tinamus guttatus TaxID=94827 RepID=UPI00052E73F9
MPSGERRPAELGGTTGTKGTPGTESFVTQIYFTLNYCSWRKTCCFALKRKQWGAGSRRMLSGPQKEDAVGRDSSSAKESLASQNANLASSRVISRMTDKSKGNGSALPAGMGADPTQQPVADPAPVNVHSTSMWLPSLSGTRASLDAHPDSHPDSRVTEEDQCPKQPRGFASITVTARRVGGPVASKAGPVPRRTPLPSQGSPANLSTTSLKVSELCSGLRDESQDRLLDAANEETSVVLRGSGRREAAALSFTSCVHLQLSQQCPNTIYYLDKSLHVCIDQPRIKHQKVHRSELSFRINCSSSRLTADGVDGIANGEPLAETLKSKLLGENKTPLRASWSADLIQNNVIKKQTTDEGYLGTKHPSKSACPPQLPAVVDMPKGPNNVMVIKKEDNKQPGSNRTTLSIRLPRPSYEA